MRRSFTLLLFLICSQFSTSGGEAIPIADPHPDDTYIPHSLEVLDFNPPPPVVPKEVPAMRADAAVTAPIGNSRSLTVIRGEASTLPDIPEPPALQPSIERPRTPEDDAREADQRRHSLQIGATVFEHRISVVNWHHPDTREAYQAVCGFDIGLMAGIGNFVSKGKHYSVMLMHSHIDTDPNGKHAQRIYPNLPEVAPDAIVFLKGNPKDPIGTAPITVLRELLASEKPRLTTYQADRKRYHEAQAAWEKANPVLPRDETIWLKPHRGSRYLADPQPEAAAR